MVYCVPPILFYTHTHTHTHTRRGLTLRAEMLEEYFENHGETRQSHKF